MKQLLILSGKGGTGKTTVASAFIKLAAAQAFADCDVDAPNLHLLFGNETSERSDFYGMPKAKIQADQCTDCGLCSEKCRFHAVKSTDNHRQVDAFLCEGCGLCAALCPAHAISMEGEPVGMLSLDRDESHVFSSAQLYMGGGTSGKLVSEVKKQMRLEAPHDAELAIVDGSPGIGCPVIASMSGANMVLIVTEPTQSGISDMERLLKTAAQFGARAAVCVNRWDLNPAYTEEIERRCTESGIPFAGRIPYDAEVSRAINHGMTAIDADCRAGAAIRDIFETVCHML